MFHCKYICKVRDVGERSTKSEVTVTLCHYKDA